MTTSEDDETTQLSENLSDFSLLKLNIPPLVLSE